VNPDQIQAQRARRVALIGPDMRPAFLEGSSIRDEVRRSGERNSDSRVAAPYAALLSRREQHLLRRGQAAARKAYLA